ncbi:MAG TPA: hypothetical protein VF278_18955 [Pirellulales bacterium]
MAHVDPVREGYLFPPIGRQSANGLIWQSIQRTGIEAELRRHFRVAERIWHCLWIVYLRHNLFSLEARWNFVADTVERLRPLVEHTSVACPHCGDKLS